LPFVTPFEQYKIVSSTHAAPGLPAPCPRYRRPVCIPTSHPINDCLCAVSWRPLWGVGGVGWCNISLPPIFWTEITHAISLVTRRSGDYGSAACRALFSVVQSEGAGRSEDPVERTGPDAGGLDPIEEGGLVSGNATSIYRTKWERCRPSSGSYRAI
jgi:hypothetical protein